MTSNFPRIFALIPCAGQGARAGSVQPKQYQLINGKPMVAHTIDAFRALGAQLAGLWVVVAPADTQFSVQVPDFPRAGEALCPEGGATRAASVLNGIKAMLHELDGAELTDWVLVHDAARCLITPGQISALVEACQADEVGGLLALPLPDTLKAEVSGRVSATLTRGDKWLAQTPQMFRLGTLLAALEAAGEGVTDESSAIEAMGLKPKLVQGSAQNFKVTYPEDFELAASLLRGRQSLPQRGRGLS